MPERRTLAEIARQTYRPAGFDLPDDIVDAALKEADFDLIDEKERVRFRQLVEDGRRLRIQDVIAQPGSAADEARRLLGPHATDEEIGSVGCEIEERKEEEASSG